MAENDVLHEMSRRRFFAKLGTGLAGMALAELLSADAAAAETVHPAQATGPLVHDLQPRRPHFPARARAVIQLFMHGGPSQVDLLDPKPVLEKYDGKNFPGFIDVQQPEQAGGVLKSPFKFARHGQSGIAVSDILPHLARCVDDICVVRSMYTEHINHEPALWMIHTGRTVPGRPSIGSWVVFGLGCENRNLPGFVVVDAPRGLPSDGVSNWFPRWHSMVYQGIQYRSGDQYQAFD